MPASEFVTKTPPVLTRHIIVGGGYSGMLTALSLADKGFNVEIVENKRWGGMIETKSTPYGLVETAANGFIASLRLLNLETKLGLHLIRPLHSAKARYVYYKEFFRWPLNIFETVIFAGFALRTLLFRKQAQPRPQESLFQWGLRCFGPGFANKLLRVAVQGIYASPAESLSASLVMNRFFGPQKQKRKKLPIRGSVSFANGMQDVINALKAQLSHNSRVQMKTETVGPQQIHNWQEDPSVQAIWLATNAPTAANLMIRAEPALAESLAQIKMIPVISLTLFFEPTKEDRHGFGFLNHPGRDPDLLGVLFNSDIYEGRGPNRSETWILAGTGSKNLIQANDAEVLNYALTIREARMGESKLLHSVLTKWPVGLPHYSLQLEQIQSQFQRNWGKIRLVGNYVNGIGLTQITDDIQMKVENEQHD